MGWKQEEVVVIFPVLRSRSQPRFGNHHPFGQPMPHLSRSDLPARSHPVGRSVRSQDVAGPCPGFWEGRNGMRSRRSSSWPAVVLGCGTPSGADYSGNEKASEGAGGMIHGFRCALSPAFSSPIAGLPMDAWPHGARTQPECLWRRPIQRGWILAFVGIALEGLACGHPWPREGIQGVQSPARNQTEVRPCGRDRLARREEGFGPSRGRRMTEELRNLRTVSAKVRRLAVLFRGSVVGSGVTDR